MPLSCVHEVRLRTRFADTVVSSGWNLNLKYLEYEPQMGLHISHTCLMAMGKGKCTRVED